MPKKNEVLTRENFIVRNSERTQWARCRQAWFWNYHHTQRWQPINKSIPLTFGDLVHRSLADWYVPETAKSRRRGVHPAKTFVKLYDLLEEQSRGFTVNIADEDRWIGARDLGKAMLENYIDTYGKDDHWIVISPEMPFSVQIYYKGIFIGTYVGVADMFVYDRQKRSYGLVEHKTAAAISTSHLFMDEQASSAWAVVPAWLKQNGILKSNQTMEFMHYNFLRKATKDDRPVNSSGQSLNKPTKAALVEKAQELNINVRGMGAEDLIYEIRRHNFDPYQLGEVSKVQPAKLLHRETVLRGEHDRKMVMERIKTQMDEIFSAHNGDFNIIKSPDRHCSFCAFRDVCEDHEIGADWEELLDLTFEKWEPYQQHEAAFDLAPVKVSVRKEGRRF